MTPFDQFWHAYPRKVGKLAARKAFDKAIKNGATLTQLLAGIGLYLQYKPVYADYCHASTWLSQGRWMDQWTEPVPTIQAAMKDQAVDWYEQCKQMHNGECGLDRWRHMTRVEYERLAPSARR
jgi:hypothetical protein